MSSKSSLYKHLEFALVNKIEPTPPVEVIIIVFVLKFFKDYITFLSDDHLGRHRQVVADVSKLLNEAFRITTVKRKNWTVVQEREFEDLAVHETLNWRSQWI